MAGDKRMLHIDRIYYIAQFPEAEHIDDLSDHYMKHGWRLGLNPVRHFSTLAYLSNNSYVLELGSNPYQHYLDGLGQNAMNALLDMHVLDSTTAMCDALGKHFDTIHYLDQLGNPNIKNFDSVLHYCVLGWKLGLNPSRDFDTNYYLANCKDVAAAAINPYFHYHVWGRQEGRKPSKEFEYIPCQTDTQETLLLRKNFDSEFYLSQNPDMQNNGVDPALHYHHFGWKLGFDPNKNFSTKFYTETYPDTDYSGSNPFCHYLKFGKARGRLPHLTSDFADIQAQDCASDAIVEIIKPYFHAQYYTDRYEDIKNNDLDPILHYISFGWRENRDPTPWFDTAYYTELYPDSTATGINPFLHYLIWGKSLNFVTHRDSAVRNVRTAEHSSLISSSELSSIKITKAPSDKGAVNVQYGSSLKINFIIPDFHTGGGGHMTIFRLIKWLEFFGHDCVIWLHNATSERTIAEREIILLQDYQVIKAKMYFLSDQFDFPRDEVVFATSWDTAYFVRSLSQKHRQFYLVQDYEPYFYPVGSKYLAAEQTYRFGLACICASSWLKNTLINSFGSWARDFSLCADENYAPPVNKVINNVPRIAFYAREHTTRRAVELGLIALEILAGRGAHFHVDFFGTDHLFDEAPYSATNWGILSPSRLSALYGSADLGVCFSATNYSLVPQEMMACKLPVVELRTACTSEVFPPNIVSLVEPDPYEMADRIESLLLNSNLRISQSDAAADWVAKLSWEQSARQVEAAINERINSKQHDIYSPSYLQRNTKASVLIPTYNAGPLFKEVIKSVEEQLAPWPFEIVIVDSSSSDGTWEFIESLGSNVKKKRIGKSEFQHGRTRNQGIMLSRGEYVALLTQDALPTNLSWLYNIVTMLDRKPQAAGAFGRHHAWPNASPFTKRDIENHFDSFKDRPFIVSRYDNPTAYREGNVALRQYLHYFSDNNACIRKSVWEKLPYPEVDYGEDQVWADNIIRHGYAKLYAANASVWHSHEYDEYQTFERARTDAQFFKLHFGYNIAPSNPRRDVNAMNLADLQWGERNGVPNLEIERRLKLNFHRVAGLVAGFGTDIPFESPF